MSIEIHEFSTGIRAEEIANGGWVSLGFTGQYMNCTLERIPEAVERSIANREFAVTEGASTEQPAIIGRVVGTGEDAWSVMAVVTRGRDEKGRSVSVYRYFLCEGDKNLGLLIADWENQDKPTFKPSDHRNVGQSHSFDGSPSQFHLPPEAEELPLDQPQPILLLPEQRYDLAIINTLALRKFNTNGQPVSWAFNVEALEQPHRFQVIQPAIDRAYQNLQRAIAHVPQVSAPVVVDEEALKSALRSLMNSSQVKPEAVQVIADALGNEQITSKYWHSLFDGQGAATAIKQKIYSPQIVRLVTLRAMVIPETLPEFLAWLNVQGGKNKADENQTISLEFQSAICQQFPKNKLANGIKLILPKLLQKEITPESLHWLIMIKRSAWYACGQEFINDVRYDLELIAKHFQFSKARSAKSQEISIINSFRCQDDVWRELISYHKRINSRDSLPKPISFYQPLGKLFELLPEYLLAAYFYQVSDGIVSKKIFSEFINRKKSNGQDFLGIKIYPKQTSIDKIVKVLLTLENEHLIIILFLSITIILGFQVFKHFPSDSSKQPETNSSINVTSFWGFELYKVYFLIPFSEGDKNSLDSTLKKPGIELGKIIKSIKEKQKQLPSKS